MIKAYEAVLTPSHLCLGAPPACPPSRRQRASVVACILRSVERLRAAAAARAACLGSCRLRLRACSHLPPPRARPRLPAVMEMAAGGSLTSYVADKWQKAQAQGLFLSEDEARYFFKVRTQQCLSRAPARGSCTVLCRHQQAGVGDAWHALCSRAPRRRCARAPPLPQQFLSAVKYCHSHCVAHRDLKLDNTLLDRWAGLGWAGGGARSVQRGRMGRQCWQV